MIKIYSTPSCVYCITLKKFLQEHDIAFEEVNVAQDRRALEEMVQKSLKSMEKLSLVLIKRKFLSF